jgi:serine protease Do
MPQKTNKWFSTLWFSLVSIAGALVIAGANVHVDWLPKGFAYTPTEESTSHSGETKSLSPTANLPGLADVKNLSLAFTTLAEEVSPTVVNIYTRSAPARPKLPPGFEELQPFFSFDYPQMKREALGSGFVIDAQKGLIVTNAHVVRMAGQNADEIMVKFIGEENGKGHSAKVVGADELTDVALLKLDQPMANLRAARLGDSQGVKVGEWVLAVGNPYGHTHTVTQGIVSGIGRNLEGLRSEFLQTSASINPGNSGGPLINMNGEVIGINSAIDPRGVNLGFAIPINTAKDVVEQLMMKGRVARAWLGIGIEDISEEAAAMMRLKSRDGVLVRQVSQTGPAGQGGLVPYDVILKIDGQPVRNTRELFRNLDKAKAGKSVQLELLRGGAVQNLKIELSERPATVS